MHPQTEPHPADIKSFSSFSAIVPPTLFSDYCPGKYNAQNPLIPAVLSADWQYTDSEILPPSAPALLKPKSQSQSNDC